MEASKKASYCVEEEEDARLQNDRRQFINIFPTEVWVQILESIEDPAQLENVCNASLYLRSLMLSGRCVRLFPQVWKLIAPELKKDLAAGGEAERQRLIRERNAARLRGDLQPGDAVENPGEDAVVCGDCGRTRQARWFSGPLALRLVCRQWNKTLESAYVDEAQTDILGRMGNVFCDQWLSPHGSWTNFYDFNDGIALPGQFLRHFNPTHGSGQGNPFFCRTLTMTFDPPEEEDSVEEEAGRPRDTFLEGMMTLLSRYGHNVWFCQLNFNGSHDELPIAQRYTILAQFLQFLPNLRCLSINFFDFRHEMGAAELEQVEHAIRTHPPPTLPQLEYLDLQTDVPAIDMAVLSRNTGTRALNVDFKFGLHLDLFRLSFQNLCELGIRFGSAAEFYGFIALPTTFRLTKVIWNIPSGVSWQEGFAGLEEKWGDTLTCVTLDLSELTDQERNRLKDDPNAFQLRLPHVTQLSINLPEVTSMDFLLPMKNSLRELRVICYLFNFWLLESVLDKALIAEARGAIRLMGAADNFLKETNVWEQFPHLQRVEFFLGNDDMFRRGDYRREDWIQWRNRHASSWKSRCVIM